MSETKATEMKPKKMRSRNIAVALGIICIILVAALAATTTYYILAIEDKSNSISSLNSLVNLANYTVIVDNQTFTQTAGNYTSWTFIANYTGYLFFWIHSDTRITDKYVEVAYNATVPVVFYLGGTPLYREGGWTYCYYDKQVNLTENPDPVFPILPSFLIYQHNLRNGTTVEIRLVNTDPLRNAEENLTMIYYY